MSVPIEPLVPAISGVAGLVGSLINAGTAKKNTDRTIKANKELAEYAYTKDMEQIKYMNEYNAPTAQMQRYRDAGLNSHLIYGQGTPGNQSQTAKYQAPRVEYNYKPPVDIASSIAMYQDAAVKDAQVDNLKAATRNTDARTATELVNTRMAKSKTEQQVMYGLDLAQAELEQKRKSLTLQDKQAISMDLRNQFQTYANQWAKYGITGKDALIIRSGIKVMEQLGIDPSWLINMLKDAGSSLNEIEKLY